MFTACSTNSKPQIETVYLTKNVVHIKTPPANLMTDIEKPLFKDEGGNEWIYSAKYIKRLQSTINQCNNQLSSLRQWAIEQKE